MSNESHLAALSARLWTGVVERRSLVARTEAALRDEIAARGLPAGTRLPSEAVLAKELRISRPTLREAIRVLAQEGLLEIRHGVGTFVAATLPSLHNALDSMSSLTSTIRTAGGEPRVRSLVIEQVDPPRGVAGALGIAADAPVARIRRARLMGETSLCLAQEFLPLKRQMTLKALRNFDGSSLYEFLRRDLGISLLRSEMTISAIGANAQQAQALNIKADAPLLLMKELHFGEDDERVLYSINHHNSAVTDLTLVRAGVRT